MPLRKVEVVVDELVVVFLNLLYLSHLQHVVPVVHELAQGVESPYNLVDIRDDRLVLVFGQRCHVVRCYLVVYGELHLLRVYKYEFQLVGVFLVKQRCDDGVKTNRLSLSCGTGHEKVGQLVQVEHEDIVRDSLSNHYGQLHPRLLEFLRVYDALHGDNLRFLVWNLYTDGSASRYWGDDTYSQCCQVQGDVILKISDLVYSHAFGGSNLI